MKINSADIGVIASGIYFLGFGIVFIFAPSRIDQLGLKWMNQAGKTEVRCYYGGLSIGLSGFLAYMLKVHFEQEALTLVIFLALAVWGTRVSSLIVDKGWELPYNRLAVPVESVFVVFLIVMKIVGFSIKV